jgi:alcohol dehydrogenase (cytochrome c)
MKNRILPALIFLVSSSLFAQVTYERILHAKQEPQNWLTYSGGYAGHRYSPLTQINRENVKNLQMQWVYRPPATGRREGKMENTPLVVDGVLYAGSAQEVVALDAVTGRQYWKFSRPLDPNAYYNAYVDNRGLAIANNIVFWATDDCHLIALDAKTGRVVWDVTMADWKEGYQFNVAPLIVRNMIILGPATNEAGSNCWVAAYDVKTGKELWRHYTSPMSADDPGAKTWVGDSWKHAGDPVWGTGSYDPETNLVFWGTGNPNPGWSGSVRAPGDNLYSDSVLALDADTGAMKWYFQFTPGDEYDWDSTQVPVLVDLNWHGTPRKVMLWANRNGFFYVLDRTTGKFLFGKPFIKVTWATGLDKDGRPIKAPGFWPKPEGGIAVMPGSQGGTNWYPPSYDPQTGLLYLSVWDNYLAFSGKGNPGPWAAGQRYVGNGRSVPCVLNGHVVPGSCGVENPVPAGGTRPGATRTVANYKTPEEGYGAIRAIDPQTGEKKWDFKMVNNTECGVLSTAGGLVFGGGMDGDFIALDAKTGEPLWHVYLGGPNASGPISYAVNGKQYIIGTGEGAMYSFALPD